MSYAARDGINGVELHSGEAWFNHSATGNAFFVAAAHGASWSWGGRLDVAAYDGAVTVIAEQNPLIVRVGGAQTQVAAGNAVRYRDVQIGRPYEVDLLAELAWRNGRLVFMGRAARRSRSRFAALAERQDHDHRRRTQIPAGNPGGRP